MLKDYFSFSRNERNGIIILFSLILIMSFLPKIYATLYPNNNHIDYEAIAPLIAKWDSLKPKPIDTILFSFNPNTASKDDFLKLGLSRKVASNIMNYRNKGGKFYKKESFKKVWDLEETDYQRLLPYMVMDVTKEYDNSNYGYASKPKYESKNKASTKGELFSFDPNTATKEDFAKLGLSDRTANNIVNYRKKGAKFYKKEDFKKIWALKEVDYQRLLPYIAINNIPKEYDDDNYGFASKPKASTKAQVFPFDPNTASKKDFVKLGLSERTANNIVNYRKKGANFETKAEFKKVWGITEDDFNRLSPYINIVVKMVDINTATATDFKELRGIGESLSNRIIKFRNQLGGFTSIDQLGTMYGLTKETFVSIKPKLKRTNTQIKKININTATSDDLKAHPYIKWKEANLIIEYRNQHGNYKNIEDIMLIRAFKQPFFDKIKDYLTI